MSYEKSSTMRMIREFQKTSTYRQMLFSQVLNNKEAFCYFADTCIMNGVDLKTARKIMEDLVNGTYGANRQTK